MTVGMQRLLAWQTILLGACLGLLGCGDKTPVDSRIHHVERLQDYQYVRRTFFYLTSDPAEKIDPRTVSVWVDDRSASGDFTTKRPGIAHLDPRAGVSDSIRYFGNFRFETGFTVRQAFSARRGIGGVFIELDRQLDEQSVLAVTYRHIDGSSVGVSTAESLVVKMLRPNKELLGIDALGNFLLPGRPGGYWNSTLPYEMKNVYRLDYTDINPDSFQVGIYDTRSNPRVDTLGNPGNRITEIVGLDNEVIQGSSYQFGIGGKGDGKVDNDFDRERTFVDYSRGLILFPDTRPFFYQPDPGAGEAVRDQDHRPALLSRAQSDTLIYLQRDYNPNALVNRYYFEASFYLRSNLKPGGFLRHFLSP